MLRVAIVGGGLAGTAAATTLARLGIHVELFERTARLGGRASSAFDPVVQRRVDNCMHVLMGCCTEAFRFYETLNARSLWRPLDSLRFVDQSGRSFPFRAARGLPAPFHLARAFCGLRFLSVGQRLQIARAMAAIPRRAPASNTETFGDWLRRHGQSDATIQRFWDVVVRGALASPCDSASKTAAMKVFRDAFLTSRMGHVVYTPHASLDRLHHEIPLQWLEQHDVNVRFNTNIREVVPYQDGEHRVVLRMQNEQTSTYDAVIVAVPWHAVEHLFPASRRNDETNAFFKRYPCGRIPSSAITAVHLWLDRPLSEWEHAVLIDEQGDWMFRAADPDVIVEEDPTKQRASAPATGYHYMLVRSGTEQSPTVRGREAVEVAIEKLSICATKAETPKILHWRFKHHPRAVFSVRPETEAMRPPQETSMPGVFLAGDGTQTGWPGTIEGAVRSGRMAAEAVLRKAGLEADPY